MNSWTAAVLGLSCLLVHCGGAGTAGTDDGGHTAAATAGGGGTVLTLRHAKGLSDHPLATVTEYQVVVTAEDMEPWIAVVAVTHADEPLTGIPAGEHRQVVVDGRNHRGDVIVRGVATDITIEPATVTTVELPLAVVPIFTNLQSEAVEFNTRFRPEVLAAPDHTVRILQGPTDLPTLPLVDLAVGSEAILIPSTGITRPHFAPLPPGLYAMAVEDTQNGEVTTITVELLDGTLLRAAPLVSAGRGQPRHLFWVGGGL